MRAARYLDRTTCQVFMGAVIRVSSVPLRSSSAKSFMVMSGKRKRK